MSWGTLFFVGLIGGFVLACVISRSRFKLVDFICITGLSGAYVGGAVLFFNCMFDYTPAEIATQRTRDSRSGPATFVVNLKEARTHGGSQLYLKSFNFRDTSEGICVRVHRGSLFLSWYTVDPYRDCPGASAAHDAIEKNKANQLAASAQSLSSPEIRCAKGDKVQCQRLCDSGKKYLSCGNQDRLIMGPAWTVEGWAQGFDSAGRYSASVSVICKAPLSISVQPPFRLGQQTIEFHGEQFRGPISKGLHKTMADALSEVCVTARASAPGGKVGDGLQTRPDGQERGLEARGTGAASIHKCQGPDGKITFTDAACPK